MKANRSFVRAFVLVACALAFVASASLALAQEAGGAPSSPPAAAPKAAPAKSVAKKVALIDLNSATKEQLMTLPGVSDSLALKIIDSRPFKAKNELVQKKLVSAAVFKKLGGKVTAKQAQPAKPAEPAKQ